MALLLLHIHIFECKFPGSLHLDWDISPLGIYPCDFIRHLAFKSIDQNAIEHLKEIAIRASQTDFIYTVGTSSSCKLKLLRRSCR